MKSRRTLITLVLLAVLLVFGLAQTDPVKAQSTTLYVTPFTPSRGNTCEPTTMYVRVGSVTNLTAYHLELTYDTEEIEIISIDNGGFLNATDAFYEPTNTFGADTGRIKWGMAQRGTNGDPDPKSGTGALIIITFQPLVAGVTTTITLDGVNSMLVDWPDAFAIPYTVPADKGAASYSLTGEVVSNVSASPAVNYCSLATATSEATSGDELRFLNNFEEFGIAFVNNKSLTIDTNGFTATRTTTSQTGYIVTVGTGGSVTLTGNGALVTQTGGAPLNLSNGGVAVVNGPTLTGGFRSVRVNGDSSAYTWTPTYSTFTLESGNLTNGVIVQGNGATAIINGGTVSRSDGEGAITGNGTVNTFYNYGGTSVTVNGGTINAGTTAAIYQPQSGTLTINGGTINGITSAIEMKRGDLTVTGGTITGATDGILIDNPSGGYVVDGAMTVDISGGVVTGTSGYAVRERVPSGGSLRTTSVEISGGDFTGGMEGVIFSNELLAAASANPPTAVLALTDGRYSHDPDRFVFAPYGSYLESPWWLIDQLVGTIERDPGNTGDIPGVTPLTVTVTGDTIDFLGEIAWYPADPTVGRTEGHRVGVEINAPAGFPTTGTTFTFNGNTYNWNTVADGDNFVWIYPKVTAVPQSWDVVVTWKEGVTQTFTINVLTGSKLEPTLSADTFSYVNDPDNARGSLLGVTSNWKTTNVLLNDVASLKVELFGENENGDEVLLQTNTENMTGFVPGTEQFDSPFNIFGKYSYLGSPWNNTRQTEFGQHLPATRIKATMTLHDGRVYTAENTIITGNRADIVPTLNAQDFGYMASSGVKGVTAGFGTQKVTLDQAVSIKVELFTGEVGAYQLLQSNTAIAGTDLFSAITNFSSPFDIFGTFDYLADGYWVNVRETEYGQTAIPTRVLATVELPGQFFMTAENTTLTGDRRTIVSTLDEEIKEAQNYVYDPEYVYTGDKTFDDTSNTYTMKYWPAEYLDGAPMRDLARYLGALYYQDISTVESITYKGVVYTWDVNGTLVGSNWKDANGTTLVSVVVADLQGQFPGTATMTLSDGLNTADVTFVVDVYNTLDAEIASAPSYVYDPVYNYVGTFAFEDATNTYSATYTDVNYNPGALNDLARYLGALHRQAGATIIKITYDNVDYTWDPQGTLLGSNWKNANGTTLVSVIAADFQNGTIKPGTGFTFTVADGIHTETVTFIIIIQDTTPPTIESIVATGSTGYDEVTAVGTTLTVDQGYTVDHITVTLSEAVTITDGTVVTMGGVPYGTISANGAVLTIVPYAGNEVASVYGTFEFSVPAGSIKDLAGNPLATTTVTLVVNNVAPVAADDGYATAEDTPLSIAKPGVLANDTDLDDLTAVLVAGPANGILTLNADGSFVYTPNANFNGTDTFTYKANDGDKDSNVATVTITVTPVNDAPVAQDITVTTPEDTAIDITLLGTDVDGDALTYTIGSQPANGTLTIVDNVVTYTPNDNWHGTDSFTYKVNDGVADSNVATVTITVTSVNDAPVAQDIEVTTAEDTAIDITLLGTDIDGDTLTYAIDTDPGHGTVTLVGNVATYTPNQDYNGTDSFTYKVNDGTTDSNVATVTITITPVKDQVIAVDDFYSVNQGQTLTIPAPGVYSNDKNPDNDPWVVSLKTGVQHGTLALNQNGGFVYTPDADFYGEDAFVYSLVTYPAIQSMWADEAKVTITVVPMPIISSNDIAGPYLVGEQQEFHVTLTNPVGGATYTNLSASIFVDDIGLADFAKAEVKHPVTGTWIPLTPVVEGNGLRLVVGPTSNYALGPDASITLTFRVNFNTPGEYEATGTMFCHDSGTPVAIASLTDTMVVYARPVISSDDIAGPYYTGYLREFNVTLTNPANGDTYTSLSASIFVDDITLGDFSSVEVFHPVHQIWVPLTPVVSGNGLKLDLGPTGNFPLLPGQSYTLTFRVNFNSPGTYPAVGTLYNSAVDPAVAIATFNATMEVLSSDIFDIEDFGLWGQTWPGALNLGWRYLDSFDLDTILSIEVGMLDANRNTIVKYTADAEQVAWQRVNGYITPARQSSAPFYVEYNGNPIQEGRDLDWTVIFGNAFDEWNPRWGYVKVNTTTNLEDYEEKEYLGERPDITAPTVGSMVARGATGFDNVTAVDMTFTVPQGYTVETIEITMSEDVVVANGTVVSLAGVPYGTLTGVGNLLTVTPYAGNNVASFIGTFTFSVPAGSVKDMAGHEVTTLEATLIVVNVAPVAVDNAYTVDEDGVLNVAARGVLANDTDFDPSVLTAILVSEPANGTLTLNADGSFVYTPKPNFNGTDTFTYKANDGDLDSNVATVTITVTPVNDAPVADDIDVTTPEDTAIDITLIGTDVDGDTLTYTIVGEPTNGTVTLVGNVATYTPNANFNGTDSFTYKVNDGTIDSNTATVNITVTPVNDAPVANDDFYTTDEDTVLTVAAPGVLSNDYDVDGDKLTVTVKTDVNHGTLVLNGDGSFVYTPKENWFGTDTFVYNLISYPSITAEGWTDEATVTITVKPVNDAPVAVDDEYSTTYETALTIAAPGVLVNDTDVEGSALTATLVAGPANGTVTLNADGSFTYAPVAGFSGTDSFTYTANDGELDSNVATVSIVVAASTNNPPIAVNDTYTTGFGVTLTVPVPGVLGNDNDPDSDPLTAIKVSDPLHGTLTFNADGSFTYVPDANFSGIDTFTYKVNDGESDSNVATVSILVEAFVNTPPVAQDQSVTTPEDTAITITLVATDADDDTLTYWIVGQPQHGTLTLAGNVATYTPDQDYNGPDSFTFKANDDTTDSNLATVSITVTPVNDAPVAMDDEYKTDEDVALTIPAPGVLANDTDVDGDTLTAVLVDTVSNGTLTLNDNGSFTYTPDPYFNGTDSFTYRAKDAELTSEIATVKINVTPVNNDVIANDDYYETMCDTILVKDASEGVLANDILLDPDEKVSIQILEGPQHGTLSIENDGSFTYTPDPGFFGTDTFRYLLLSVRVNGEWSDYANVTILVKPFTTMYLPLMYKNFE